MKKVFLLALVLILVTPCLFACGGGGGSITPLIKPIEQNEKMDTALLECHYENGKTEFSQIGYCPIFMADWWVKENVKTINPYKDLSIQYVQGDPVGVIIKNSSKEAKIVFFIIQVVNKEDFAEAIADAENRGGYGDRNTMNLYIGAESTITYDMRDTYNTMAVREYGRKIIVEIKPSTEPEEVLR